MTRTHLVMVPGFGGFDALGQMRYYTGVTERFASWSRTRDGDAELHYFDNLPTAGVATRARDLEEFLIKRVKRRAIQGDEEIVLIGHSTGGLDIRRLLSRLCAGTNGDPAAQEVRARVKRVVFMSVPHCGTNIADFIDAYDAVVRATRLGLRHAPWIATRLISLAKRVGVFGDSQLVVEAIDDLRRELAIPEDRWLAAEARRARAELALWRYHAASDFLAIRDLRTRAEPSIEELDGIECLSFATIAPNPFADDLTRDPDVRTFGDAWTLARRHARRPGDTDPIFRLAYAACSAGPFARSTASVQWLPGFGPTSLGEAQRFLGARAHGIDAADLEPWHNDGIVNTASMVFPLGKTWLVGGDHADIIGHYDKRPALPVEPADPEQPKSHARHHEAYNLLRSDARFTQACFEAIWDRVFDFAAGVAAPRLDLATA